MGVTIVDVAKKSGVSVTTVSKVINQQAKRYRISDKTANHVAKVMEEMNYRPNQMAKNLSRRKTKTIGYGIYCMDYLETESFNLILSGIGAVAGERGYDIQFALTNSNLQGNHGGLHFENKIQSRQIDGLIVFHHQFTEQNIADIPKRFPIISIDNMISPSIPCVLPDYSAGYDKAMSHLIKEHRLDQVQLFMSRLEGYFANQALAAYRKAISKYGLEEKLIIEPDPSRVREFANSFLKRVSARIGVITDDPHLAILLLKIANDQKMDILQHIRLITYGGMSICKFTHPTISAINPPWYAMGEKAAELMINMLEGQTPSQPITTINPRLYIRESCGCKESDDEDAILRYLKSHMM